MAVAPASQQEVRIIFDTSLQSAFTAANDAAWGVKNDDGTYTNDGTDDAIKLGVHDLNVNLTFAGKEDDTLTAELFRQLPHIPIIRGGDVSFKVYADGARSDVNSCVCAKILAQAMRGLANPVDVRAGTASSTGTTVQAISADPSGAVEGNINAGQALLLGTVGDGRGNGEVRSVLSVATATATLNMATVGAVASPDAIVASTTVYSYDAAMLYARLLLMGKQSQDQFNMYDCSTTFEIEGTGVGENLVFAIKMTPRDWRPEPSATRESAFAYTYAEAVNTRVDPRYGGAFIQDNGTTTRAVYKIADLKINPNVSINPVGDVAGPNGIGDWVRVRGQPSFEATILLEGNEAPLPSWENDFLIGANKQAIFQFGRSAQKTVAFEFPRFCWTSSPMRVTSNGLSAVKVTGMGIGRAVNYTTANTALLESPLKIHFF